MSELPNVSRRYFLTSMSAIGVVGLVGGDTDGGDSLHAGNGANLDLAEATCTDFAIQLGSIFRIVPPVGRPIEVELVRARELRRACETRGETRNPFTLMFRGDGAEALSQGTYRVEHARLGEFPLFLVPVGRGGQTYEAIFG